MVWERVYTVTHYYDRPRGGVADFQGKPHVYKCVFDKDKDDWSDDFLLLEIDQNCLDLAMEDWAIWLRWSDAWHKHETGLETHPALPADKSRHEEISKLLEEKFKIEPVEAKKAQPIFRNVDLQGNTTEVKWSLS